MGKLSDVAVRHASTPGMLPDGAGLYLAISARKRSGVSKSWVCRYTAPNGKRREKGLGGYPEVSLATARRMAIEARQQAREGVDPLAAKEQARAAAEKAAAEAMTFRECAEAYIEYQERERRRYAEALEAGQENLTAPKWTNAKHAAQWAATLKTYAFPIFGDLAIGKVDSASVIRALKPIWNAKHETAKRVRGRIAIVLDYAIEHGYRAGPNPAQGLKTTLPTNGRAGLVKHHAALAHAELPAFLARVRAERNGAAAAALEFTILTAARTGEALGARWSEIDLDARVWTVPAKRMKAKREHRVPLSAAAIAVLEDLRGAREKLPPHIFTTKSGAPLSGMAMLMVLRRMNRADLTVHGFRSTFRDWVAERTNFPREVAEAALAHTNGDKVEAAYRRSDLFEKRQRLMEAWGAFTQQRINRAANQRRAPTPSVEGEAHALENV